MPGLGIASALSRAIVQLGHQQGTQKNVRPE